ncbi:MAG: hypothetical protein KAG18_04600 [Sinobacterium sp.]|nr:hypothetical protein [Sinobacterium sp.]
MSIQVFKYSSIQVFKYSKLAVAALSATLLISCGSDSKSSGGGSDILQGTWKISCAEDSDETGTYDVYTDIFTSNTKFEYILTKHSDSACEDGSYTQRTTGTYALGSEITLDDDNKVFKYDEDTLKVYLTLDSDDYTTTYNSITECGHSDWVKGEEKDVSDCTPYSGLVSKDYSIVDVQGDKLFYGDVDSNTGDVDGNRYSTLDTTEEYIKQ